MVGNMCSSCFSSRSSSIAIKESSLNRSQNNNYIVGHTKSISKKDVRKHLLKSLLQDCISKNDFEPILNECERRFSQKILKRSVITTIIRSFGIAGKVDKAIEVLGRMKKECNMKPDIAHYGMALSVCQLNGAWNQALQVHTMMLDHKVRITTPVYTSLINIFTRAGKLSLAKRFLESCKAQSYLKLDAGFYNNAIAVYGKLKDLNAAMALFDEMDENNVAPDAITYSAILSACARVGNGEQALEIARKLKKEKEVKLNKYLYTAMMQAFIRSGQWKAALEVFDEMKADKRVVLDLGCLEAGIRACALGTLQDHRVLEILQEISNQGLQLSATAVYAALQGLGASSRAANSELVYSLCVVAAKNGLLPTISKSKLDLRQFRGDPRISVTAIWYMLQQMRRKEIKLDNMGDVLVILGNKFETNESVDVISEFLSTEACVQHTLRGHPVMDEKPSDVHESRTKACDAKAALSIAHKEVIPSRLPTSFFIFRRSIRSWLRRHTESISKVVPGRP